MKRHRAICPTCKQLKVVDLNRGGICGSCRYLSLAIAPGDWTQQAACTEHDPELFWPDPLKGKDTTKQAQEICLGCPVANDCLEYAITSNQTQGIWGGLTGAGRLAYAQRLREAI
jgi:WhiB family redox-sensing transcriptional regulator